MPGRHHLLLRELLLICFLIAPGFAHAADLERATALGSYEVLEPEISFSDTSYVVNSLWGQQELWGTATAEYAPLPGLALNAGFSALVPAADEIYAGGDNWRDRYYLQKPSGIDFSLNLVLTEIADISFSAVLAANHSWRDIHSGVPAATSSADFDLATEAAISDRLHLNATFGVGNLYDPGAAEDDAGASPLTSSLRSSLGIRWEVAPRLRVGADVVRFTGLEWDTEGRAWALQAGPLISYQGEVWKVEIQSLPRLAGGREMVARNEHQNLLALERNRVLLSLRLQREF
jgi:hypothetical protein